MAALTLLAVLTFIGAVYIALVPDGPDGWCGTPVMHPAVDWPSEDFCRAVRSARGFKMVNHVIASLVFTAGALGVARGRTRIVTGHLARLWKAGKITTEEYHRERHAETSPRHGE